MTSNKTLIKHITDAIQERKGQQITLVDLTGLDNSVCDYFVICEGTSNTQILAITDHIEDYVREHCKAKPYSCEGQRNALWIAMDYGDIMVHIFNHEARQFYDLERLWSDAALTEIPSLS